MNQSKVWWSVRALARKLRLIAFSRNWEIRQVCTKDRHHGWQQEFFLLQTVPKTLERFIKINGLILVR